MTIIIDPVIAQGSAPHGQTILGNGPKTIGGSGCLFTATYMIGKVIGSVPATLLEAHALCRAKKAFIGSALKVPQAAVLFGMVEDDRTEFDRETLSTKLKEDLPVILGFDYKDGRSSGFSDADHFVVATGMEKNMVTCADPGSGRMIVIDLDKPIYKKVPLRVCEMILFGKMH